MLKHLCRVNDWGDPVFFMDQAITAKVQTAVTRLEPELAVSLREVEKADFILVMGADPINEAPMLALAMRQAQRNGARNCGAGSQAGIAAAGFYPFTRGIE